MMSEFEVNAIGVCEVLPDLDVMRLQIIAFSTISSQPERDYEIILWKRSRCLVSIDR